MYRRKRRSDALLHVYCPTKSYTPKFDVEGGKQLVAVGNNYVSTAVQDRKRARAKEREREEALDCTL